MNLYKDENFGHHSPLGNVPNFIPPKPKSVVKNYPLKIENWGDDVLMLALKYINIMMSFGSECFKEYDDFAKCLDYFDQSSPEIPEELKAVSDMYHVIKGVLDKGFTFETPLSTEQGLMWVREVNLDEFNKEI